MKLEKNLAIKVSSLAQWVLQKIGWCDLSIALLATLQNSQKFLPPVRDFFCCHTASAVAMNAEIDSTDSIRLPPGGYYYL